MKESFTVENASKIDDKMDYAVLLMAVYAESEFSSVGLTEVEAREKGSKSQLGSIQSCCL